MLSGAMGYRAPVRRLFHCGDVVKYCVVCCARAHVSLHMRCHVHIHIQYLLRPIQFGKTIVCVGVVRSRLV